MLGGAARRALQSVHRHLIAHPAVAGRRDLFQERADWVVPLGNGLPVFQPQRLKPRLPADLGHVDPVAHPHRLGDFGGRRPRLHRLIEPLGAQRLLGEAHAIVERFLVFTDRRLGQQLHHAQAGGEPVDLKFVCPLLGDGEGLRVFISSRRHPLRFQQQRIFAGGVFGLIGGGAKFRKQFVIRS